MAIKNLHHKLEVPGSYSPMISQKLDFLVKGISEYHFNMETYEPDLLVKMDREEVLTHLYHILLNFIDTDESISLCKVFVLYGVKLYEQKDPVNSFLVSFIRHLDRLLYDNEEFITLIDIVNQFIDDPKALRDHIRVLITIKEKMLNYYMDVTDAYHMNLKAISVSCKDFGDLFKSFSFLFSNYDSNLLKRLIDKLRNELGCQNINNVRGSTYVRAMYSLYNDQVKERQEIRN